MKKYKIVKIKEGYIEESSSGASEYENIPEIAEERPISGEVSLQKYNNLPFLQWNQRKNSPIWESVGSVFYIQELK